MLAAVSVMMLLAAPEAEAASALEPQVRVHVGANYVSGPSPFGIAGGMDARLTRVLGIDLGGFVSPGVFDDSEFVEREEEKDYYFLRHAIYFAPGIRIPHAQPRSWAWDIFVRGGAGVVWFADTSPEAYPVGNDLYPITAGVGGFGGLDALVRVGRVGVRASGRAWVYEGQHQRPSNPTLLVQPQISLEGFVQF